MIDTKNIKENLFGSIEQRRIAFHTTAPEWLKIVAKEFGIDTGTITMSVESGAVLDFTKRSEQKIEIQIKGIKIT